MNHPNSSEDIYYLMPSSNEIRDSSSQSSAVNPQRIAPKTLQSPQQSYKCFGESCYELYKCKKRIHLGQLPTSGKGRGPQPAAVARRNERERNRVRQVNMGFAKLRQHVPNSAKNKKMSKVDTLRSAVEYIRSLQDLLGHQTTSDNPLSQFSVDENSYPVGGQSSTGSPTPSVCSDASSTPSPYDTLQGDEDDELMEFASWF